MGGVLASGWWGTIRHTRRRRHTLEPKTENGHSHTQTQTYAHIELLSQQAMNFSAVVAMAIHWVADPLTPFFLPLGYWKRWLTSVQMSADPAGHTDRGVGGAFYVAFTHMEKGVCVCVCLESGGGIHIYTYMQYIHMYCIVLHVLIRMDGNPFAADLKQLAKG